MTVGGEAANILASCWTGAVVIALTNPLDCLKQRWQVAQMATEPNSSSSMRSFTTRLLQTQGLWVGLWKPGLITNCAACTVTVGTRLGLYPHLRQELNARGAGVTGKFGSGLLGGALGYVCAAPLFFATRVAHAAANGSAPCMGVGTLGHLQRDGGLGGLWRGASVLVARGAIMSGTQLATYDTVKSSLKSSGLMADGPFAHCVASFVASVTMTTAICPFDFVLTIRQVHREQFSSASEVVQHTFKRHGVRGFFRGWVPLWARFLPSSLLTFILYEQARRVLLGTYLD